MNRVRSLGRYSIHEDGRVWTEGARPGWLTPTIDGSGYPRTTLGYVHRLVWEAFNGPIPSGMQINHLDGDKENNTLSNLDLCTPSENSLHSIHVLGNKQSKEVTLQQSLSKRAPPNTNIVRASKSPRRKLTDAQVNYIRAVGDTRTYTELAKELKVDRSTISRIHKGEIYQ